MLLSVIIPVYNERATIDELLRRVAAVEIDKETIIVDDGSTDGTRDALARLRGVGPTVVLHNANLGKGAAVRSGLRYATGDCVLVQDADLEYDPDDYHRLVDAMEERGADAVYGSRFAGGNPKMTLRHRVGNRLLTGTTNVLYGSALHRHGDLLQADSTAGACRHRACLEPLRHRTGDYGEAPEEGNRHPRGPDSLRRAEFRRRQEDLVDGLRVRHLDACSAPPHDVSLRAAKPE